MKELKSEKIKERKRKKEMIKRLKFLIKTRKKQDSE